MAGRRTKYNAEVAKKITDAIRLGATYDLACAYAGISTDSFTRWQDRYADFAVQVKEAEGANVITQLARIQRAAQGEPERRTETGVLVAAGRMPEWRAATWMLEHRHPEQYGRQVIENYRRDVVARIAEAEGVDAAKLYDLAFEREKRRTG